MSSQKFIGFCVGMTLLGLVPLVACSSDDPTEESKDPSEGDDDDDDDDVDAGKGSGKDAGKKDAGGKDSGGSGGKDAGAKDAGSNGGGKDAGKSDSGGGATSDAGGIDSGKSDGPEPEIVSGCDGAKLYAVDDADTGAVGPWPVGVKTLKIPAEGGTLTVEIWYPAKRGSEGGKTKEAYDLRSWLPEGANMVPDEQNALAKCDCFRDLPLDSDHGPYPAVLLIHGLGSFRISSMSAMALWASRGFVAIAADHPGPMLTDFLAGASLGACSNETAAGGDMSSQSLALLAQLDERAGDFAFLGDAVDTSRIGLAGHSQGGGTVAGMSGTANVKIIMTLAPLGGGALSSPVDSMLQVTGTDDQVTGYSTGAFTSGGSAIQHFVGVTGAGHIDVTDLCKEKNPQGRTGIQVAADNGVCGALALSFLAQCGTDTEATDQTPLIVGYATTAALEETLHCKDRAAAWDGLEGKYSKVSELLQKP